MSLVDIALLSTVVVLIIALVAAVRRPDRKGRYFVLAGLIVAGCWLGVWWLANALCCY